MGGGVPILAYQLTPYGFIFYLFASLVAQMVENLPAMQETRVRSMGGEDPLEKGMAALSSILAWRIHGQRGLAGYCHGVAKTKQTNS